MLHTNKATTKTGDNDPYAMVAAGAADSPLMRAPAAVAAPHRVETSGESRPYIGHATRKSGSGGGSVTWARLDGAGVGEGAPYLCAEGEVYPLHLVPLVLLEARLVLLSTDPATYRVERREVLDRLPDASDLGRNDTVVYEALVLVPGDRRRPACVATYGEKLPPFLASSVVGPWLAALRRAQEPGWAASNPRAAMLPPAMRIVGLIGGSMAKARSGNAFVKPVAAFRPPTLDEIEPLWGASNDLAADIDDRLMQWRRDSEIEDGGDDELADRRARGQVVHDDETGVDVPF